MKKLWRAVIGYFQGVIHEMRRVTWPTPVEITRYSVIVLLSIVITTLLLAGFDYGMQQLVTNNLIR